MKKLLLIAFLAVCTASAQAQPGREQQDNIVQFFPNPAITSITFKFSKAYEQGYSLQIFNAILGRKLYDAPKLLESNLINLNDFPRGLYIFYLHDRNGRIVQNGKFQVAK